MRIIRKQKDYYDYYQGVFGIDTTKTYDRRNTVAYVKQYPFFNESAGAPTELTFHICGVLYTIFDFRGEFYHTAEELKQLDTLLRTKHNTNLQIPYRFYPLTDNSYQTFYDTKNGVSTDVNLKYREPILIKDFGWGTADEYVIPLLKTFDFNKIMSAKKMYINIETFLGFLIDNPPLPDNQTNVGKIVSHGFDKKRSFRPKMK